VLVAALEGAISFAAFERPAWLEEDWFLDALVRLALGTFGVTPRRVAVGRPDAGASRWRSAASPLPRADRRHLSNVGEVCSLEL
jgi:hypothetical protein